MKLPYRGSGKVFLNEKEYNCDLYFDEKKDAIVLNIIVNNTLGSYLQTPLDLPYLSGQLENGFKFTLLNLKRFKTIDLVSYGMTEFSFEAEYILCGVGGNINYEQNFYKVTFTLSDIIEWGEESVFTIGESFELRRNDDVCRLIYKNEEVTINYRVYGSMIPVEWELLKECINLKQCDLIEICFEKEEKLGKFIETFEKLKSLIEIALLRKINLERVSAYSKNLTYPLGDEIVEYSIKVYGQNIKEDNLSESDRRRQWQWISLSELIAHDSFENYFKKHEKFAPIIELFLEPLYVIGSSETRIFLNVVQALETYHSRFMTNDLNEFRGRINEILKNFSSYKKDELQKLLMANSRKFITLESRIADLLLANGKISFDIGKIEQSEFPSVIAHTRNYYIHYDERIKEKHRVLTEDELPFYNRALLQILEYYILLELGFSDTKIIKRKLTDRWGNISQDLKILAQSQHLWDIEFLT